MAVHCAHWPACRLWDAIATRCFSQAGASPSSFFPGVRTPGLPSVQRLRLEGSCCLLEGGGAAASAGAVLNGLRSACSRRLCGFRAFTSGTRNRKKDLYRVLGASPTDSQRAIRAAYLRKAKELHPDANAHCPRRYQKERQFREVTEAYQLLSDPDTRREYDAVRTAEKEMAETPAYTADDWHAGRDEVGEEFWRQVEQIRREKEMAWRTMKGQRHQEKANWSSSSASSFASASSSSIFSSSSSSSSGGRRQQMSPAFALLRALPLLLVPVVLFYALYKSAMLRAQNAEHPLPPIVRDDLGRAFFVDSQGRHFRVVEFDFLNPNSKDRPLQKK
ncbi:hypothetical protein Efla_005635 [Eimeria flavescens]